MHVCRHDENFEQDGNVGTWKQKNSTRIKLENISNGMIEMSVVVKQKHTSSLITAPMSASISTVACFFAIPLRLLRIYSHFIALSPDVESSAHMSCAAQGVELLSDIYFASSLQESFQRHQNIEHCRHKAESTQMIITFHKRSKKCQMHTQI